MLKVWTNCVLALLLLSCVTMAARAGDYYSSVPYLPTVMIGVDSEGATPVGDVYGKEYSHTDWFTATTVMGLDPRLVNIEDHDAFATPDPLQVVSWDGLPGGPEMNSGSVDAFNFGAPGFNYPEGEVDALANRSDFLFHQVLRNEATLLFSLTADLGISGSAKAHVHFEDPKGLDGANAADVWALIETGSAGPGPGPGVNHHVVEDLDALEVWGPEPPSHSRANDMPSTVVEGHLGGAPGPITADADRFSLDMDAASGVSVWSYFPATPAPTAAIVAPWIPHAEIVAAVEELFLEPIYGKGARFEDRDAVDVDGTMARDLNRDLDMTSMAWGPGDELLFTIDPIDSATVIDASGATTTVTGIIDGGEIIHLAKIAPGMGSGTFSVSFLSHGGHLWDTAFDVMGTFGYEYEDVDALEAVGTLTGDTDIPTPEPTSFALMLLAIAGYGSIRRSPLGRHR